MVFLSFLMFGLYLHHGSFEADMGEVDPSISSDDVYKKTRYLIKDIGFFL